jgi:hypothetical protein
VPGKRTLSAGQTMVLSMGGKVILDEARDENEWLKKG